MVDIPSADLPREAQILARTQDSPNVFTLSLRLSDPKARAAYRWIPGKFNMLYLYGAGEVPISIVNDSDEGETLHHTIRAIGHVTRALAKLKPGERVGLRGPYGRGWPMDEARGHDVLVVTGGIGCAPVVAVVYHIMNRRDEYGELTIIQGVKHSADLLWRERYAEWGEIPHTRVLLAADVGDKAWPWYVGLVTDLLDQAALNAADLWAMMCGPEPMMKAGVKKLTSLGVRHSAIWLSMERNMQCALRHCGHCQFGSHFVCRDGPVFPYSSIVEFYGKRGF